VFLNCGCCLLFFIEPSFTSVISFFLTHMLLNLYPQIWSLKPGWGSRPDVFVEKGHSDDITCLKFSSDGQILLSRSSDCSLKVVMKHSFREYCVFTSLIYVYSRYLSHPSSYLYFHVLGLGFAANERGP
jgi:WD40 repeat protein